jgi:ATP-binding cassette, subfamily B, bacterial
LPAGKVTALVGANGAGKSTIVKLLTRMYDPQEGEILLNRTPITSYDLESFRKEIAVLYQDFACFALSIRDNILVGSPNQDLIESRFDLAAQWSGANLIATKQQLGYEALLTRQFEGGTDLSGGEWQKIALARSYIRDANIIILDEPSAALDAEAESKLFEYFRDLTEKKTALLISHRFSTVRLADQILVLEDGHILESGTHYELMELRGKYATLFEMQAEKYR